MKTVAITGASGFLGGALCRTLAARGWTVRALVRDPPRFPATTGVRAALCNLPDAIDESALMGTDAVVHCAYATRETDLARARRVNEEGTRRLIEASRRAGVPRMVFVSTIAAAPDAPNYYARSKHALEGLFDPARDAIVRPGLIIGRDGHGLYQQLLDNMRRLGVVPLFGGGNQPLQTVHLDDVCEAVARVVERGLTGAFNVAEPDPPTLGAFLRAMADRLGMRVRFVSLPFGPVLAAVRVIEAARLPFPLRSESLLGLKGLRAVPVADDLRRLELRARSAAESLADALSSSA
jgi:nucleoside-diphosphate-sugar epimerase